MAIATNHDSGPTLLYSEDEHLTEARQSILERSGFKFVATLSAVNFETLATHEFLLFILCNTLPPETRTRAVTRIHASRPAAKLLVVLPSYPIPELPADEVFSALEGPARLVETVRTLMMRYSTLSQLN